MTRGRWCLFAAALWTAACDPASTLDTPVTIRWHREIEQLADGRVRLVVVGFERLVSLCFDLPPAIDSSRWEAEIRFDGQPAPAGFQPIASRLGRTICFDAKPPPGLPATDELALCARVVDRFDGRTWRPPCGVLRFEPDATHLTAAEAALAELLGNRLDDGIEPLVRDLDRLASEHASRLPVFALRIRLVAAHYLAQEGTPEALADARHRLMDLPTWLEASGAEAWQAQAAHQRALFHLHAERDLALAWSELQVADDAYRRMASGSRLAIVSQKAAILARSGAGEEALRQLREAVDDCQHLACRDDLVGYSRGQLAWLILLDPASGEEALEEAEALLEAGFEALDPAHDGLEMANQKIELAYLRLRQGHSTTEALAAADRLLQDATVAGDTVRALARWAALIRAL
ncbi:MAG: hypothetical protein AAF657_35275, partial [Acidobacteriota bacterium]